MSRRSSSTGLIRKLLGVTVASLTISAALVAGGAGTAGASGAEYDFLARINSSRSQHGLHALSMSGDLQSIARDWSQHMASGGCPGSDSICHNPNLTSQVHNWRKVGENVGVGPTVSSIESAFMNSSPHRANILDPDYTQVGIGTAYDKDGQLYVTQDFRQPMSSSSSSSSGSSGSKKSHHSTSTHHASAPVHHSSSSSGASAPSAPTPSHRAAVRHKQSKADRHFQARLRALSHRVRPATDPVGQAVDFVSTMGILAG